MAIIKGKMTDEQATFELPEKRQRTTRKPDAAADAEVVGFVLVFFLEFFLLSLLLGPQFNVDLAYTYFGLQILLSIWAVRLGVKRFDDVGVGIMLAVLTFTFLLVVAIVTAILTY